MTVEELSIADDDHHFMIDEDISILKKHIDLPYEQDVINIQSAVRRYQARMAYQSILAAILIQSSFRMLRSRMMTIRFVADGQDSPLVTLKGRYLCGKGPIEEIIQDVPVISNAHEEPMDQVCITISEMSVVGEDGRRRSSRKPAAIKHLLPSGKDTAKEPTDTKWHKITMDNTKKNALYTTCRIVVEEVPMPVERRQAESPPRNWSKKPPRRHLSCSTDEEEEESRLKWNKSIVFLDELPPKAPIDKEVVIPVKPILKKVEPVITVGDVPDHEKQEITVRRHIHPDGSAFAVEDMMDSLLDELVPPQKGRGKKKAKQPVAQQNAKKKRNRR